jgi:hypothetical protein
VTIRGSVGGALMQQMRNSENTSAFQQQQCAASNKRQALCAHQMPDENTACIELSRCTCPCFFHRCGMAVVVPGPARQITTCSLFSRLLFANLLFSRPVNAITSCLLAWSMSTEITTLEHDHLQPFCCEISCRRLPRTVLLFARTSGCIPTRDRTPRASPSPSRWTLSRPK